MRSNMFALLARTYQELGLPGRRTSLTDVDQVSTMRCMS
jgi:hypothetical protein